MTDLLGQTIGAYQLIELISQSDKNLVFKGFQPDLNRYVAVKILSPSQIFDPGIVQQFRQEVQLIAGLAHQHILPVYDYGQQDDLLYMVTPYVEGATLRERLPQFYAPERARQLITSIAEALTYIHSQGVVHGNLKPSNILFDEKRQPLLTDFGAFQNMGTLGQDNVYQSPEQRQGGPVDGRTDIYALGVLLYTLMTGETPPSGAVPSPRLKRPDLSSTVEKVILKAMAQSPEQRFQTVAEFMEALNVALPDRATGVTQPTAAVPPPGSEPESGTGQDNRQMIFLIGGLAVVLLALIVCAFFFFFSGGNGTGELAPTPTLGALPEPVINYPVEGRVGESITFDGSESRPGDGGNIVSYEWDFGDGNSGRGDVVSHVYDNPGTYRVTLTVTDENGFGNTGGPVEITIRNAEAPPPEPTPTLGQLPEPVIDHPVEGRVGEPVTFNGSESRPGDGGDIVSYEWNFGDGNSGSGDVVNHVYDNPGTYQVTLTVTDENGFGNTSAPVQITIREADEPTPEPTPTLGRLPEPVINYPIEGRVGESITFEGSESRPGDGGNIVSYEWDFGDGNSGRGDVVNHVYDAPGTYQVTLTVTDEDGLGNTSDPVQITIREADEPTPEPTPTIGELPSPVINHPIEGQVGQPVTFDGSESQPGSSPIASYNWDFGDGNSGSGDVVSHVYDDPGTYQVTLTVTDEDGLGNTAGPVEIQISE